MTAALDIANAAVAPAPLAIQLVAVKLAAVTASRLADAQPVIAVAYASNAVRIAACSDKRSSPCRPASFALQ